LPDHPYAPGEEITEGDRILFRRLVNRPDQWVLDPPPLRPGSGSFEPSDDDGYTSMYLKDCVSREEVMKGHEAFGLCEILVSEILQAGATKITYEPDDGGYGHCGVWGLRAKPGRKARRAIAIAARVVVPPLFARQS